MRKNNVITFEFDRDDLEILLGSVAMTIQKMEWTQNALKEAADVIRAALQEDDEDEPAFTEAQDDETPWEEDDEL